MQISGFQGEYRFLSNFYPSRILMGGDYYNTVEHAYQAAKTLDSKEREVFQQLAWPQAAKKRGRFLEVRHDWTPALKIRIMLNLLRRKFGGEYGDLTIGLLKTESAELVEWNTWGDTFWGVTSDGGENWLGRLLMQVRDEINVF